MLTQPFFKSLKNLLFLPSAVTLRCSSRTRGQPTSLAICSRTCNDERNINSGDDINHNSRGYLITVLILGKVNVNTTLWAAGSRWSRTIHPR